MKCIAIELLTEIRDSLRDIDNHLRNLDTLEERRQKDRERQDKCRNKATTCHVTEKCHVTKESEKGKETFPPAPPIEKREKSKKTAAATAACVRAREEFTPPSREDAVKFAESKKIPTLFVDYWIECMNTNYRVPWFDSESQTYITDWVRSLLCYWSNADKDKSWLAFKTMREKENLAKAMARSYTAADWALCAERCANCDGTRCTCGLATPPACAMRPHPPEECPRFVEPATHN